MGAEEEKDQDCEPSLLISAEHQGVSTTQVIITPWFSLGYIYTCTECTHKHTSCGVVMMMHWLFDGACDVSAGLRRGQSCRTHPVCAPWTHGRAVAVWSSASRKWWLWWHTREGRRRQKPKGWKLNKNKKLCPFEAETAKKWWIVFLQSSVGELNMPDDAVKYQIKSRKITLERSYNWRDGEVGLVEPNGKLLTVLFGWQPPCLLRWSHRSAKQRELWLQPIKIMEMNDALLFDINGLSGAKDRMSRNS